MDKDVPANTLRRLWKASYERHVLFSVSYLGNKGQYQIIINFFTLLKLKVPKGAFHRNENPK